MVVISKFSYTVSVILEVPATFRSWEELLCVELFSVTVTFKELDLGLKL